MHAPPLLVCAVLIAAGNQRPGARTTQTPRTEPPRAATPVRDTARPAVQPPPTIVVEAPSQVPVVAIGGATLLLLAVQLWIMARQTRILDRQTTLAAQQAQWRRDEAIGTFYRLAHDLVGEFRKANILPMGMIPADYNTHPRQVLRGASRVFAPLGNDFIFAANEVAMRLDLYFSAVEDYNAHSRSRQGTDQLMAVQELREQVGRNLDRASRLIPDTLRWRYSDGKEYDFGTLCSLPPSLLEALGIESSTPPRGEAGT